MSLLPSFKLLYYCMIIMSNQINIMLDGQNITNKLLNIYEDPILSKKIIDITLLNEKLNLITCGIFNISTKCIIYGQNVLHIAINQEYNIPQPIYTIYFIIDAPKKITQLKKYMGEYVNTLLFDIFHFKHCIIKIIKSYESTIQNIMEVHNSMDINDMVFYDKNKLWINILHPFITENTTDTVDPFIHYNMKDNDDDFKKIIVGNKYTSFLKYIKANTITQSNCYLLCKYARLNMLKKCVTQIQQIWIPNMIYLAISLNHYFELIKFMIDAITDKNCSVDNIIKLCATNHTTDNIHIIEYILSKQLNISNKLIYDIIDFHNIDILHLLIHNNVNMNITNSDGLTPIEYAINLYMQNIDVYDIMFELNKTMYLRNPKYWSYANNLGLYVLTPVNSCDKNILESIKKFKNKHNSPNNMNIIILNNIIIKNFIKYNKINDVITFLKFTDQYCDINVICHALYKYKQIDMIKLLTPILLKQDLFIMVLMTLGMYDLIDLHKESIEFTNILKYVTINGDYKSLIYLLQYINKDYVNTTFDDQNTLLHILIKSIKYDRLKDYIICFRILMTYNKDLINQKNKYDDIPIFMGPIYGEIISICVEYKSDINITTTYGDTILHHIIRYSNDPTILIDNIRYLIPLINKQNNDKDTPLMLALKLRKINMCYILLSNQCDINIKDKYENSIFHYMNLYNVQLEGLTYDGQINNINMFGNTPNEYIIKK